MGLMLLLSFGESAFAFPELKQGPTDAGDRAVGMGWGRRDGSQLRGQEGKEQMLSQK